MKYNLMSYYQLDKDLKKREVARLIRDNTDEIMIDSGAHSFQKGKKVSWDEYTDRYAEFIKEFDRPNVIGYFEMDVDKIIGLKKVVELRRRLEKVTDKIIPVWHKGRGIDEFKAMCQSHTGRVVAISGFANEDIKDDQYLMFLKYAWKCGCRIHCLGMTRKKILDKIPFDYTDSSSWLQFTLYGRIYGLSQDQRATRDYSKKYRGEIYVASYLGGIKLQKHYQKYWGKYDTSLEKLNKKENT